MLFQIEFELSNKTRHRHFSPIRIKILFLPEHFYWFCSSCIAATLNRAIFIISHINDIIGSNSKNYNVIFAIAHNDVKNETTFETRKVQKRQKRRKSRISIQSALANQEVIDLGSFRKSNISTFFSFHKIHKIKLISFVFFICIFIFKKHSFVLTIFIDFDKSWLVKRAQAFPFFSEKKIEESRKKYKF